ncbi:MAG: sulfatase-like hydrolase/transferase [Myxococcota bacterium]
MSLILELVLFAFAAFIITRLVGQPWRARLLNALKAWLTVRMVWVLAVWPITGESGEAVPAWQLVLDVLRNIDAATFWTFAAIGAAVRFVGVVGSMVRWLLVLRGQGIEFPFRHVFGAFLIGRAIGFFLPSTAGLDAYKLYDAARFSGKTVEVTAGTVLEKVLGVTGIFLTFLVALPFGISIFGDNATTVALITVPMATGIIGGLLLVLWYPQIVQWVIENIPIPGKARLEGLVKRLSNATAAYRDQKAIVVGMLGMSFLVHFTTAAMYYFMAIAVGAAATAAFWPIVFGSAIQIFATVIGPTIGGLGVREAAQLLTVGAIIGAGPAIVSATLGFWIGEVPTLFGFFFWMLRGADYRPAYARVNGEQVDYEAAAQAATELETPEEKARREADTRAGTLPGLGARILHNMGLGLGTGILAGLIIGITETVVIARGGFGGEAQVLWYGPLAYALFLGGLSLLGGAFLGILPMSREESNGWTPSLGMLATLVPFGLAITLFRLRRDVYLEQMPPAPVLLGVLAVGGAVALLLFFGGRRLFATPLGTLVRPLPAVGLLALCVVAGAAGSRLVVDGSETPAVASPTPAHLEDRPNLILVMVDTLRADHLSCYDPDGAKTPHICSLAEGGGTRFEGFSHASWTKPATASLVTSLLPSSHKAMSKVAALPQDAEHVAETLQAHGYATGGIASNINLAESFGFDQGYDEYHYLGPDYLAGARESSSKIILYQIVRSVWFKLKPGLRFGDFYQDSEVVNGVAFDFLERHRDSRFFLFLHYMDPHDPYFEHPYDGRAVARVSTPHPDAAVAEELRRLYKGEIEYLDGNFGKLLAKLDELGIADDTVIALTADHGEEFHEHGGWWHGLTLYDEQIRVPLLVRWSGHAEGPADGALARHIDVVPTLIGLAGADVPEKMQGVSLLVGGDDRREKDQQVFSEEDHEGNVLWSLRTPDAKIIVANPDNPRGLPERAFFRIGRDPGEQQNLAGGAFADLESTLERHAEAHRSFAEGAAVAGGADVEMTHDECEQLRLLGYVEDCSHIEAN